MPCTRPITASERAATLRRAVAISVLVGAGAATMAVQHRRDAASTVAAAPTAAVASAVRASSVVVEPGTAGAARAVAPTPAAAVATSVALSRDEVTFEVDVRAMPLAEAVRRRLGADANYGASCNGHTCTVRVLALLVVPGHQTAATPLGSAVAPAAAPPSDPPGLFPSDG